MKKYYNFIAPILLAALLGIPAYATTHVLKITIANGTYSDEIAIRYMPGATVGFDGCCDAWKLFAFNNAVPQLFTRTDLGDELAINSLPSLNGTNNVDLFVRTGSAATYSITPTKVDSFSPVTTLTLIDNVTGITYDLKALGTTYLISLPVIALGAPAHFSVKITPPLVLLPVELIRFAAVAVKKNVLLSWTTASETNSESFKIERAFFSPSGGEDLEFVEIGAMDGAGNSITGRRYEFMDSDIPLTINHSAKGVTTQGGQPSDILYYRLKQTDYNGDLRYYGPISVMRVKDSSVDVKIYPTVSSGVFYIAGELNNAVVDVYTAVGQLFYSIQGGEISDSGSGTFELPNAPNGIYHVNIKGEVCNTIQKIIINQ